MKLSRIIAINTIVAMALLMLSGCGKKNETEMTVLIRMMPNQKQWFEQNIVAPFEKENNCKINLATFETASKLEWMLELDAKKSTPKYSLVKTPFEVTHQLVADSILMPLQDAVSNNRVNVKNDMAEYNQIASALAMYNNEFYYIPRKLETRILFYRKSKVADAISKFGKYRNSIDSKLKALNNYGLPKEYKFEENPSEWDIYDLFVVGYIWSNEEYNGSKYGRIAHRGAKYNGTALFLIDRAYQLGATPNDIKRMNGPAVEEMFLWEKIFKDNNIYNPSMWSELWKGADLYNAVRDGKAFLTYFQQIDCFTVHGWENDPKMPGYLSKPDDMGVAIVPKGVSFTLNKDGIPQIDGNRRITIGGWWWGIPKAAPQSELAYKFARYITNKENNAKESTQFGMIPVRKDLLQNLTHVFNEDWVGDVYKVSIDQANKQLSNGEITIVPKTDKYPSIAENYIDAWGNIVRDKKGEVKSNIISISDLLESKYVPEAKRILGSEYPKIEVELDSLSENK